MGKAKDPQWRATVRDQATGKVAHSRDFDTSSGGWDWAFKTAMQKPATGGEFNTGTGMTTPSTGEWSLRVDRIGPARKSRIGRFFKLLVAVGIIAAGMYGAVRLHVL